MSYHFAPASLHHLARSLADACSQLVLAPHLSRIILSLHPKYKKKRKTALKPNKSTNDPVKDIQRALLPGLAMPDTEWKPSNEYVKQPGEAIAGKEIDDLMSQLDGVRAKQSSTAGSRPTAADFHDGGDGASSSNKRPRHEEDSRREHGGRDDDGDRGRPRQRENGYGGGDRGGYGGGYGGRPQLDEKPILYKIYDGKVSGWKDFGAFVSLEGLKGRFEGTLSFPSPSLPPRAHFSPLTLLPLLFFSRTGMVHIGSIAIGGRVNNPGDLLTRNQACKVKVMSVAGSRLSLSMKDVDQKTGADLTPHLRIKSEAELAEEARRHEASRASLASSGSNATPLYKADDDTKVSSAKRLTSPERWEIKQLIASGVVDASEYPNLDEDFSNAMTTAEVEEEVDIEVRDDEAPFLAGQKRHVLEMSPVKVCTRLTLPGSLAKDVLSTDATLTLASSPSLPPPRSSRHPTDR